MGDRFIITYFGRDYIFKVLNGSSGFQELTEFQLMKTLDNRSFARQQAKFRNLNNSAVFMSKFPSGVNSGHFYEALSRLEAHKEVYRGRSSAVIVFEDRSSAVAGSQILNNMISNPCSPFGRLAKAGMVRDLELDNEAIVRTTVTESELLKDVGRIKQAVNILKSVNVLLMRLHPIPTHI